MHAQRIVVRLVPAVFFVLLLATSAPSQLIGTFGPVTIEASRMPTRQLPGYSTWRLSASSDLGIRAFDFTGNRDSQFGDSDAYGFFGPMNQIFAAGQPVVFTEFSDCCSEFNLWDSQFLLSPSQLVIPSGVTSESSTHLRSAFASPNPFENPVEFVQLVRSDTSPTPIHFRGVVVVGPLDNLQEITVAGTIPPIPEPRTTSLIGLAILGLLGGSFRKRF